MIRKRLGILRGYYVSAHRRRMDFYSWKWRLFLILFAALLALFINDYLQAKYAPTAVYVFSPDGIAVPADYSLSDKLFNWFMTGVLFGIVVLAAMYEGEFILGLNRMVRKFEKTISPSRPHAPSKRKAVKQRKK